MNLLKNFYFFFEKKDKIFFSVIIFFSILQVLAELIGIASIIPFVTILFKPESSNSINFLAPFINTNNFVFKDNLILIFSLFFFLIFLIKNLIVIISSKITYKFVYEIRAKIYKNLLKKILSQDYLFFVQESMSKIFNITFQETNNYAVNVVRPLINLITELLICLSIFFLVIFFGNSKGLIVIIPVFLLASLFLKKFNKSIKKWSEIRIADNEKIMNLNVNLINGIKEIFIYGKEKEIYENFKTPLSSLSDINIKNSVIVTYPKIILEQSVILILLLIILYLNFLEVSSEDIIITLSFYLIAAYRLLPSINKIFVSIQQIKFGEPSIPVIMQYYNLKRERQLFLEKKLINKKNFEFNKNIILENISFFYTKENNLVLKNINLNIKKKECIGIIGASGTGKSTFINLLLGLLIQKKGIIKIDEIELSKNNLNYYQNLFSITSQDSFLINGTIKENIIFGSSTVNFDEKRINESLKFARLEKMVDNLPEGINSDIGTTLKKISSGQKQRIAIARAFYINKQIMVFDEATNALDEKNEKIIINNIKNLKSEKTIIIISHNKKNIEDCDRILEFKNSEIMELNKI